MDDDTVGSGTMVWSEEKPVKLKGVKIITYLGDETPLDGVDFSHQYWVQVERLKKTGYAVVGTRTMLGVTPYALWAITPGGEVGPTGPTGPTGQTGDQGIQGVAGPLDSKVRRARLELQDLQEQPERQVHRVSVWSLRVYG